MHRFALQNLHEKELICTSTGRFFVGNRGKFCAQRDILYTNPRFPCPQRASLLLQQASTICQHFHSIVVLRILLNNSGKCWNTPLYTSIISRFSVFKSTMGGKTFNSVAKYISDKDFSTTFAYSKGQHLLAMPAR